MNAKKFSEAMSELDIKYIEETISYKKKGRKKAKKPSWVKWGAMAACFAVVVVTAVSVLPNYLNQQNITPSDALNEVVTEKPDSPNNDMLPVTSEIRINMSDIVMSQVDGFVSSDYERYNPETDDEVVWGKEDIWSYVKKKYKLNVTKFLYF